MLPAFDERFEVLEMFGIPAVLIGEAFPARNVAEHFEAVVVEFNERGFALCMENKADERWLGPREVIKPIVAECEPVACFKGGDGTAKSVYAVIKCD